MNINEKEFKIFFPKENIYIMRDHNWAFTAWEIERLKGNIGKNSVLLHVDYHTDYCEPNIDIPDINDIETAKKIGKQLEIFSFIKASEYTGTIKHVFMISDEYVKDDGQNYKRAYTFNHFDHKFRMDFYEQKNEHENDGYILDIDLDFFNTNMHNFIGNNYNGKPWLYSDEFIIQQLQRLRCYTNWKAITIAISPEYCGGLEAAEHLYDLALESFNLCESEGIVW